jgi:hypothetical protein
VPLVPWDAHAAAARASGGTVVPRSPLDTRARLHNAALHQIPSSSHFPAAIVAPSATPCSADHDVYFSACLYGGPSVLLTLQLGQGVVDRLCPAGSESGRNVNATKT